VAAESALRVGQRVDSVEVCPLDTLDDELRDPIAPHDGRGHVAIVVDEVHQDFPSVSGVDCAGRVEHCHAEARR
jgi:hypothetical protein